MLLATVSAAGRFLPLIKKAPGRPFLSSKTISKTQTPNSCQFHIIDLVVSHPTSPIESPKFGERLTRVLLQRLPNIMKTDFLSLAPFLFSSRGAFCLFLSSLSPYYAIEYIYIYENGVETSELLGRRCCIAPLDVIKALHRVPGPFILELDGRVWRSCWPTREATRERDLDETRLVIHSRLCVSWMG